MSRTPLLVSQFLVACVLLTTSRESKAVPESVASSAGHGAGTWLTPEPFGGPGLADGVVEFDGVAYQFQATLTRTDVLPPPTCLSCLHGNVVGTLDDGVGAGPDYYVSGGFSGESLTGLGSFSAAIRSTPFPVGLPEAEMRGGFASAPGAAGTFRLRVRTLP